MWWLVVGSVLIAAGAAFALSIARPDVYEAEVRVSVPLRTQGSAFAVDEDLEHRMALEIAAIEGAAVSDRVAGDLGLAGEPPPVRAAVLGAGRTIRMSVRATEPDVARVLLDAYVRGYSLERLARDLDDPLAITGIVSIVDPIRVSDGPVEPRVWRDLVLGGAAGLPISVLGVLAMAATQSTVRRHRDLRPRRLPVLADIRGAGAGYEELLDAVPFAARSTTVVQVVGCGTDDGSTATAAGLALAAARNGHKVLALDANLRSPSLGRLLDTPQRPGLLDLLDGEPIDFVIRPLDVGERSHLGVIASGGVSEQPIEDIARFTSHGLLDELRRCHDVVIIDSSAATSGDEVLLLAAAVDSLLLVVRPGHTSRRDVARAVDRLEGACARIAGFVLSRPPRGSRSTVRTTRSGRARRARTSAGQHWENGRDSASSGHPSLGRARATRFSVATGLLVLALAAGAGATVAWSSGRSDPFDVRLDAVVPATNNLIDDAATSSASDVAATNLAGTSSADTTPLAPPVAGTTSPVPLSGPGPSTTLITTSSAPATTTSTTVPPTTAPSTTVPSTSTVAPSTLDRSALVVVVANANGVAGIAGAIASELVAIGYGPVTPTNASERAAVSVVYLRPGLDVEGSRLVADLGWEGVGLATLDQLPPIEATGEFDLVVLIGSDRA